MIEKYLNYLDKTADEDLIDSSIVYETRRIDEIYKIFTIEPEDYVLAVEKWNLKNDEMVQERLAKLEGLLRHIADRIARI